MTTNEDLQRPMLPGRCTYGEWLRWVEDAEDWQYLVVKAGGIARKSDLDTWLMNRHGISMSDAHDIANHIEYVNRRVWKRRGDDIEWCLSRPEPTYEKYGMIVCITT